MVSRGSGDDGGVKPSDVNRAAFAADVHGWAGTELAAKMRAMPKPPPCPAGKKRVLFVCIGNSCRSQMAEAFARAYGRDVIDAHSAGCRARHRSSHL